MTERRTWYFTFGFSHKHPRTDASLANCYTTWYGTYEDARKRVIEIFGTRWAFQYGDADGSNGAGVTRFNLTYVPCVTYEPGELLPPSPHEMSVGEWHIGTVNVRVDESGKMTEFGWLYEPTFKELLNMMIAYDVPLDARIEYAGCGTHSLVVTWTSINTGESR